MSVDYKHRDYEANEEKWIKIRDAIKGQDAIKSKRETYLTKPNPDDTSAENAVRYNNYLKRAVYFNVVKRTLDSLVGTAFRRYPTLETQGSLEYVESDIDGIGISIYQQSQKALCNILSHGRCGFLVDFPSVNQAVSLADMSAGYMRANCLFYEAEAIINWQHTRVGGKTILSKVVLSEAADIVDGFETKAVERYRELSLEDGVYIVRIWEASENNSKSAFDVVDEYIPRMANGEVWREIPFIFAGSTNNDFNIDDSPMYPLVEINLAHYQNSADFEDSVHIIGQPQPFITGLTERWAEMLEEKGVYFGSRAPIALPQGASFGIVQAGENVLVEKAMARKEAQMVALGARLLEKGSAIKTATEAQADQEAETSVLALAVSNLNEAYAIVAMWMEDFMGSGSFIYEINNDFSALSLDANRLNALVAGWLQGAIPKTDLWAYLRKAGVIDDAKTDEEIEGEVENSLDLGPI